METISYTIKEYLTSDKGNRLIVVEGNYADYYFWTTSDRKFLRCSRISEYTYLSDKLECNYYPKEKISIPEIAKEIEEDERRVGRYVSFVRNKALYKKAIAAIFQGIDRESLINESYDNYKSYRDLPVANTTIEKENALYEANATDYIEDSVDFNIKESRKYKRCICTWSQNQGKNYGDYCETELIIDGVSYQVVFTDYSDYDNDYRGRIRRIFAGINYIEFDFHGSWGHVNNMDFAIDLYRTKTIKRNE